MVKEWPMMPIGDILDFKNGLNKSKEFFGHGTPIVNYTDVYHHSGLFASDIKGTVSLNRDEIRRFEVRKNDVFFTRTSETPDEVGLSAVMLEDIPDCVFSGFVLRGRPKNDVLIPEYCKYCFSAKAVREKIVSNCTYTTRALTNGRVLSAIEIPVPPKDEQRAIAGVLTEMEVNIANLAELIEKKKAIRDGALEDLVSGKTRLTGYDNGIIPNIPIGAIQKVERGKRLVRNQLMKWGGYPVYQNSMEPLGYYEEYNCESGSVFIIAAGSAGEIGFLNTAFWAADDCYYFKHCPSISQKYLYYALLREQEYLRIQSRRTSIPRVSRDVIDGLKINLPLIGEQEAIADVLTAMDVEIKDLEDERNKMIQIREGAMDDLLTGRVRLAV